MSLPLPTEKVKQTLRQIAALRLAGKSWNEVAEELHQPKEAIEQLVIDNDPLYWKYLRRARNEFLEVCFAQAAKTLQELAQRSDEKVRQSAANSLLRIWQSRLRYQTACQRVLGKKMVKDSAKNSAKQALPSNSPANSSTHHTPSKQADHRQPEDVEARKVAV